MVLLKPEDYPLLSLKGNHFASKGDDTAEETYIAVGRTLSSFERMDAMFSHLFGYLVSGSPYNVAALRAYGGPDGHRDRMRMIEESAGAKWANDNACFFSHFQSLIRSVKHLGNLRNQIAHGVVEIFFDLKSKSFPENAGWCVMPSYARSTYMHLGTQQVALPTYVYSAKEMEVFVKWFYQYTKAMQRLVRDLTGEIMQLRAC